MMRRSGSRDGSFKRWRFGSAMRMEEESSQDLEAVSHRVGSVRVRGAREHNLKNVPLEIPRDALVVFSGVSGSGKSSLAFGTLYAEAQRRYLESVHRTRGVSFTRLARRISTRSTACRPPWLCSNRVVRPPRAQPLAA